MGSPKLSVYHEFGRSIPGFAFNPVPGGNGCAGGGNGGSAPGSNLQQQPATTTNFPQSLAVASQGRRVNLGSYWGLPSSTSSQQIAGSTGPPPLSNSMASQQFHSQPQAVASGSQQV